MSVYFPKGDFSWSNVVIYGHLIVINCFLLHDDHQ